MRVVDGEPVVDGLVVDARVALGQVQGVARPAEVGLRGEVRGFDDQRVTLPVAARIAQPLADRFRDMRAAVERDDPRLVDQLLVDDDVARHLEDLVIAAVPAPDAIPAARDAAGPLAQVAVGVGGSGGPAPTPLRALGGDSGLPLGGERRNAAVRRIHDQGRAGECRADVPPERVVVADAALPRRQVEGGAVGVLDGLRLLRRQVVGLGQAAVERPLQRGRRLAVPLPLQIGVAPRGSGRRPTLRGAVPRLAGRGHGRRRGQHHEEHEPGDEESAAHVILLVGCSVPCISSVMPSPVARRDADAAGREGILGRLDKTQGGFRCAIGYSRP